MTGLSVADVKRGFVGADAAVAAPRAAVSFVAQVILVAGENIHAGLVNCRRAPCNLISYNFLL